MTAVVEVEAAMGAAVFSDDGRYRYRLDRIFEVVPDERKLRTVLFVMLNPSLAGAYDSDPTIRKCEGFARRWGFQRLTVVNLFGLVTPYPGELGDVDDPIGPECDSFIRQALTYSTEVVVSWGANAADWPDRTLAVLDLLTADGTVLMCLGKTSKGYPRHPGRIPYATKRERF